MIMVSIHRKIKEIKETVSYLSLFQKQKQGMDFCAPMQMDSGPWMNHIICLNSLSFFFKVKCFYTQPSVAKLEPSSLHCRRNRLGRSPLCQSCSANFGKHKRSTNKSQKRTQEKKEKVCLKNERCIKKKNPLIIMW